MLEPSTMAFMDSADSPRVPRARSKKRDPELRIQIEGDLPQTDARRSLRAQMLATEHWSLLASRSTTQTEILTRIAIFLTLVSAGLVSLGILGQVSAPDQDLRGVVAGVLAFLLLVGMMTQVRVTNAMTEDLMYVAAMNRLRGGYVDLDPGVAPYLMASPFDDAQGIRHTYYFLGKRDRSHVFGSSGVFILVINTVIAALLAGDLFLLAGVTTGWATAAGVVVAIVVTAVNIRLGYGNYLSAKDALEPLRPTPAD